MTPKKLIDNAIIALGKDGITPASKNGKIVFSTNQKPGGPWVYARYTDHNCIFWKNFVFTLVVPQLPKKKRFIPQECMGCYKVVVRPETYKELLLLKDVLYDMNLPGKVGIEVRAEVDALYGGYWYCDGIEEGFDRLGQIRFALSGTKMEAFLKRACTEYEREFGPSDKWKIVPGQKAIEDKVVKMVEIDNTKKSQTIVDVENIMEDWRKFAKACGPNYKASHNYVTYEEGRK
ncbi:hypothetical protein LCGC14_1700660 [marine sediment metagenome]|uniref:Uncharacterized protein n=1 Tax=marine sediment metagenome TaxID=412755 RepID=A0A0F9I5P4_9ZZZZ